MAVKARKTSAKDQGSDRDKSQSVSGKSKRGKDGKTSASQSKNGVIAGFIRSKLGLSPSAFGRGITVLLIAIFVGFLHWYHLSHLFENDRHFSHMSTLEKEMAFRTEMGLYYSYFKTVIEAPSFMDGMYMIMNDRLTEYPLVINTLKRFNLYPEVVLASWYRAYTSTMEFLGFPTKMCWTINRGEGLEPVESCEVDLTFYSCSGSRLGGTVTVLCFFFNHGESTRVMWTPPLRESFSYPFLVLQMLLLTHILRTKNPSRLTACDIHSGIYDSCKAAIDSSNTHGKTKKICEFCCSCVVYLSICLLPQISLAVCFLLMFGNSMLLTSFYASSLLSIWGLIAIRDHVVGTLRPGFFSWVLQCLAWVVSTIILKFILSRVLGASDDAHISSLIKSKFTNYKDFDTMMYTCAAEFDFIEAETPIRYFKTMLLPVNLLIVAFIAGRVIRDTLLYVRNKTSEKSEDDENEQTHVLAKGVLFGWVGEKCKLQLTVLGVLVIMAIQGVANLQSQWGIIGEFSNYPQEELLEWIKDSTSPNAVFAGAMPTMASVKLSTGRAIVNHPHYEDAGLRERTKMVYAMYSRKPAEEVRRNLIRLQVNYFILEDSWCTRRTKPGCSMPEIWDVEDAENAGKVPLCTLISKDSRPHFNTVFHNNVYKVLQVSKTARARR
ncbi:hypothetical protein DNTS_032238 [Danionella cerebrum]|uniref:C-mannosyltransferase DPY19L1 n=1 Tax=Danionella cerebrum TaxID=2873325 RepID=A0A553Q6H7_9TELE|nr:hypothetical protein DNTS_032238 [Danionella translucida]